MRFSLFAAVFVIISACGLPPGREDPRAASVASQEAALCSCTTPPAPSMPLTPVNFARAYPRGTPLYPSTTTSIATVVFQNALVPHDFLAYGFDPARNLTVFYVSGAASDLPAFQTQHHLDVSSLNIALMPAGASVFDSYAGQVIEIPPRNPPMGQEAFAIAIKSFWANH